MPKFIDLTNTENEYFYILDLAYAIPRKDNPTHNLYFYRCVCKKCKSETVIRKCYLSSGHTRSCGCTLRQSGKNHKDWKGSGELSSAQFSHIVRSAKIRKIEFKIDIDFAWKLFEKQQRKCALTGLEMTMTSCKDRGTASLDRIDNDKGYLEDNVRWVLKDLNLMKRTLSDDQLIFYCRKILEFHEDASPTGVISNQLVA